MHCTAVAPVPMIPTRLSRKPREVPRGVAARVARSPSGSCGTCAREGLDAGDAGQLRPAQRTDRHDHEPRGHAIVAVGRRSPSAPASSSHASAVTCVWKHALVVQAEVPADPAAVLEDLGAVGVLLGRHVADLLEQRQVDVRLDVALHARVAVPVPRAAEVAAPFSMIRMRSTPGLAQPGPASSPLNPPPTIATSTSSATGRA